jgi:hypothetical protein
VRLLWLPPLSQKGTPDGIKGQWSDKSVRQSSTHTTTTATTTPPMPRSSQSDVTHTFFSKPLCSLEVAEALILSIEHCDSKAGIDQPELCCCMGRSPPSNKACPMAQVDQKTRKRACRDSTVLHCTPLLRSHPSSLTSRPANCPISTPVGWSRSVGQPLKIHGTHAPSAYLHGSGKRDARAMQPAQPAQARPGRTWQNYKRAIALLGFGYLVGLA